MTHPGNRNSREVHLGENYKEQRITVSGTGYWWAEYLLATSEAIAHDAGAEAIQAVLRKLPYFEHIRITQTGVGEYLLTPGPQGVITDPLRVRSTLARSEGYVDVATERKIPMRFHLAEGPAGLLGFGTFQPTLGRTDIGNLSEHKTEYKVREWFFGHDLLAGVGARYVRPQKEPTNALLEGDAFMAYANKTGKPPAVHADTIHSSLLAGLSPAVLKNRTFDFLGRTTGGVRQLATFDPAGQGTTSRPAWKDYTLDPPAWKIVPYGSTLQASVDALPIVTYKNHAYWGWEEAGERGYLYWNGVAATNAAKVNMTANGGRVVAWAVWDQKLFALSEDGGIRATTAAGGAATNPAVTGGDWELRATYQGTGYPYALIVFPDADGNNAVHLFATDGIYVLQFEPRILDERALFGGPGLLRDDTWPQANSVVKYANELHFAIDGQPYKYDGKGFQSMSWDLKDGIPTNGLVFNRELFVRSFTALKYGLIANCTAPYGYGPTGTATVAAPYTLSGSQSATYYNLYSVTGLSTPPTPAVPALRVTGQSVLNVVNSVADWATPMYYTGQGWVPIIKPKTYSGSGHGYGNSSSIYHELQNPPRVEFAPGWCFYWWDHPGDPYRWADQRWELADVNLVFPFLYSDVQDVPKAAYMLRVGYEGMGDGATLTAYWQSEGAQDQPADNVGHDPSTQWVQFKDPEGRDKVIGASDADPKSGVMRLYLDRDEEPAQLSRGRTFYELRPRFKLTTTSAQRNAYLRFASLVHGAKFGNLFSYPIRLDIGKNSPDDLTPEAQLLALKQLILSPLLHYLSLWPDQWEQVAVELGRGQDLTAGDGIAAFGNPYVTLTLSEQVRL